MTRSAFWLACTGAGILSLMPSEYLSLGVFNWWDKAQHATAFATLCALGLLAYPMQWRVVLGGLLAYGACIEVAQAMTGWRYGEFGDLLADAVGIGIGWLGVRFIRR